MWKLCINGVHNFQEALDGFVKVFDVKTYLKLKEQDDHYKAMCNGYCCDIWVKGDCFVFLNFAYLPYPDEDDRLIFNEKIEELVYDVIKIESSNPKDFQFVVNFLKKNITIANMDRNFNLRKKVLKFFP